MKSKKWGRRRANKIVKKREKEYLWLGKKVGEIPKDFYLVHSSATNRWEFYDEHDDLISTGASPCMALKSGQEFLSRNTCKTREEVE